MLQLATKICVVTPMFLGGSVAAELDPLRASSIKGLLRYWYRAVDPQYRDHEGSLFGGTGKKERQSAFLLRVGGEPVRSTRWVPDRYEGLSDDHPDRPSHSRSGSLKWKVNGIRYLSFPFDGASPPRQYIVPGSALHLKFLFREAPSVPDFRRIVASLWLLGHIGGAGSRSRRGFGTIALHSWEVSPADTWQESDRLPIAHGARSSGEWMTRFKAGLEQIRTWFPPFQQADHTVLGDKTRFWLCDEGYTDSRDPRQGFAGWERAMDAAGRALQKFRMRWDRNGSIKSGSDYHIMEAMLRPGADREKVPPPRAPARVAFGMPLTFKFSDGDGTTLVPADYQRSASPVIIRVVRVGDNVHPFFIRLDAPVKQPITEQRRVKREDRLSLPADDSILDKFWESLPEGSEVRW